MEKFQEWAEAFVMFVKTWRRVVDISRRQLAKSSGVCDS
jgi:hypothetical protein